MVESVRRVITAYDGSTVVNQVEKVEPAFISNFGLQLNGYQIWGSEQLAFRVPNDGMPGYEPSFLPPLGDGLRVNIIEFFPENEYAERPKNVHPLAIRQEQHIEERVKKYPNQRGLHATDTVDIVFMISGELTIEQGDGVEEVTLRPGDCMIQSGTPHNWRNRTNERCVMGIVLLGAVRRPTADDPHRA